MIFPALNLLWGISNCHVWLQEGIASCLLGKCRVLIINCEAPQFYEPPIWLLAWNMNFIFPDIGNVIIPTDFHIFQRGRHTTNQQLITLKARSGFVQKLPSETGELNRSFDTVTQKLSPAAMTHLLLGNSFVPVPCLLVISYLKGGSWRYGQSVRMWVCI